MNGEKNFSKSMETELPFWCVGFGVLPWLIVFIVGSMELENFFGHTLILLFNVFFGFATLISSPFLFIIGIIGSFPPNSLSRRWGFALNGLCMVGFLLFALGVFKD